MMPPYERRSDKLRLRSLRTKKKKTFSKKVSSRLKDF
jgi:hypothetical protein